MSKVTRDDLLDQIAQLEDELARLEVNEDVYISVIAELEYALDSVVPFRPSTARLRRHALRYAKKWMVDIQRG